MTFAEPLDKMMASVAREILGAPNKDLSRPDNGTLKWGNHGSIEVNTTEGWFHDYECKVKGGVLDLIAHKAGISDHAAAFRWLEDRGIKEKSETSASVPTFYDYRDEVGAVLFRVERKGIGKAKTFLQHGPDGKGGLRSARGCMQGVRRVPYRVPELIGADADSIVFNCEGEKDADRLTSLGLVATTNPGGAGKFEKSFASFFAGRRVAVLEDNDEAGRNHASDVLAKLQGVATAAIVRLPGLPDKGDVSDWLDSGGTVAELVDIARKALLRPAQTDSPKTEPASDDPAPQAKRAFERGISAAALMAKQFAPVNYVVPGLMAEGTTIFAGAPKIGKSWMAYGFALALASGRPVFGSIPITQGDVLYLALEDSERRLKSRLLKMGIQNAPERLTLATEWPGLDDGCIAELEAWADTVKRPTLVIVDVLKMVRGQTRNNETVYDADYRAMVGLGQFARARGIAVIVVHHTRKMEADDPLESISGTNGLTGAADSVMVLKRDKGTGHCILYVRGRDIEESEKAVRFKPDNGTWELLGAVEEVGRTNERQAILDVLRKHDKPLSVREISDVLGRNYDATRKTLARMWDSGEVQKAGRGAYTCPMCPDVRNTPQSGHRTDRTGYESGARLDPSDERAWDVGA